MIILRAGDIFAGRFRLEERIGQGGMGAVWRATQLVLGREVALKLILPTIAEDERYRALFAKEARLSAQLVHPNIVPVVDYGETDEILWLVQQFIRGQDLGRALERSAAGLPVPLALYITMQILHGLSCAHENHVIHRDIKPGNVMLSLDGHVLLCDFGIAKRVAPGTPSISTAIKGSPGYIAPEILRGEPVRPAADLFAVGGLLWEALTGRHPFVSERHDRDEIFYKTLNLEIPALAAVGVEAASGVDAFVQRLLAKSLSQRYSTAAEALIDLVALTVREPLVATAAELRRFVRAGLTSVAPPERVAIKAAKADWDKTLSPSSMAGQVVGSRTSAPAAGRRRRGRKVGALLTGVAVVAGTVIGLWLGPARMLAVRVPPRPAQGIGIAASARARLTLEVTPSDARVFLDERRLVGPPYGEWLPMQARVHLRVEGDGYESYIGSVALDGDLRLPIALVPRAVPPSLSSSSPTTQPNVPPARRREPHRPATKPEPLRSEPMTWPEPNRAPTADRDQVMPL